LSLSSSPTFENFPSTRVDDDDEDEDDYVCLYRTQGLRFDHSRQR
jgi:hypothetical protein